MKAGLETVVGVAAFLQRNAVARVLQNVKKIVTQKSLLLVVAIAAPAQF